MNKIERVQLDNDPVVIGVVADTHIPDRVGDLHPLLLQELRLHQVQIILHAGDISIRQVLSELETVAPVRAVTGNRDFLLSKEIPNKRIFQIQGLQIVLTHGHLNPHTYWMDKFQYVTKGYQFERYQHRFERAFPQANVIIFGHTHHPEIRWIDGKLYFNPGSVSHGDYQDRTPNYGLIKIYKSGRIETEIIPLKGAFIHAKKWVEQR
jgi:putative phosphoesterase